MIGDVDVEVLAGGCRRRGGRGRFVDLGAALCCNCQTGARVKTDGEVDMVTRYEAAAVGEDEE